MTQTNCPAIPTPIRDLPSSSQSSTLGAVVSYTAGQLEVDYPGNPGGPLPAISVLALCEPEARALAERKASVVLAFVDGRPEQPIILGVVQDRPPVPLRKRHSPRGDTTVSAEIDGRQVVLEGKESVELRCGKASILLGKDGKITIRGTSITSRSSGANRLRGGSVEIN